MTYILGIGRTSAQRILQQAGVDASKRAEALTDQEVAKIQVIAIPFTKLYHVVGFFLSRGQLGMDFGIKRDIGGKGFAW